MRQEDLSKKSKINTRDFCVTVSLNAPIIGSGIQGNAVIFRLTSLSSQPIKEIEGLVLFLLSAMLHIAPLTGPTVSRLSAERGVERSPSLRGLRYVGYINFGRFND